MRRLYERIEDVMYGRDGGGFMGWVLYLLSGLYGVVVRLRYLLYRSGMAGRVGFPCSVISVGNVTVGGTGKTPMVMYIAGILKEMGKDVVVLSRGYGGSIRGVGVVSDGRGILLDPEVAGDEPYLMARRLEGVAVVVGRKRALSGAYAIERFKPQVMVLDDGFQHLGVKRDLDIVLFDSSTGVGNGYLLPRGILREPIEWIRRADIVMIKGKNPGLRRNMEDMGLRVFDFSYRPVGLIDLRDDTLMDVEYLRDRKITVLAGIANPDSFVETLKDTGAHIMNTLVYPDHHPYGPGDVERIKDVSMDSDMIVTTEKDGVRLKRYVSQGLCIWALRVEVVVEDREGFLRILSSTVEGR